MAVCGGRNLKVPQHLNNTEGARDQEFEEAKVQTLFNYEHIPFKSLDLDYIVSRLLPLCLYLLPWTLTFLRHILVPFETTISQKTSQNLVHNHYHQICGNIIRSNHGRVHPTHPIALRQCQISRNRFEPHTHLAAGMEGDKRKHRIRALQGWNH
jgi:hypothetical protein